MCNKKDSRGIRASVKIYDDFMVNKEEFDNVIKAFDMSEKHIVPYNALLYASSAWKEGEE